MAIQQLESLSSLAKHQLRPIQCNHSKDAHVASFRDTLNKATAKEAENDIKDTKPPSKDQLTEMIYTIKKNMDMKLLDALSLDLSPGNNPLFGAQILHRLDLTYDSMESISSEPTESIPSNFWHTSQCNDTEEEIKQLDIIITQAAKKHGVDEALIKSVIKAESNYNPNSTSAKGAMGLMQLMPETARELGVQNPYDPMENIDAGTRYLKKLLKRYDGDVKLSLAAYNWGMGNIERKPNQMPIETKRYIALVTNYYELTKG